MLRSLMIWSKQFGSNVCASSSWPKFNKEFPMCVCVCRFPEVRGKECSSAKRARYTSTNTYVRPSFCAPRPSISNVSHLSNSQTYTPKINYIYICMTRIRPLCRTHNTMVWSLGRVNQQQKSAQRKCARFWAAATFRDAISIAKTGARNLCDNPWRQVDGWIFILDAAAQYFYPAHTSSTSPEKKTTTKNQIHFRTHLPHIAPFFLCVYSLLQYIQYPRPALRRTKVVCLCVCWRAYKVVKRAADPFGEMDIWQVRCVSGSDGSLVGIQMESTNTLLDYIWNIWLHGARRMLGCLKKRIHMRWGRIGATPKLYARADAFLDQSKVQTTHTSVPDLNGEVNVGWTWYGASIEDFLETLCCRWCTPSVTMWLYINVCIWQRRTSGRWYEMWQERNATPESDSTTPLAVCVRKVTRFDWIRAALVKGDVCANEVVAARILYTVKWFQLLDLTAGGYWHLRAPSGCKGYRCGETWWCTTLEWTHTFSWITRKEIGFV